MLESFKVRKGYEAAIHCSNCLAIMNTITYDNEEDATEACIKAWNRRDGEQIMKTVIATVIEKLEDGEEKCVKYYLEVKE